MATLLRALEMLWLPFNRQLCFLRKQFVLDLVESRFKKCRISYVFYYVCTDDYQSYGKQGRRHYCYKEMRSTPNETWNGKWNKMNLGHIIPPTWVFTKIQVLAAQNYQNTSNSNWTVEKMLSYSKFSKKNTALCTTITFSLLFVIFPNSYK